jgi:deoxyribodipyrimidine photolyase-related protein
MRVALIFPHQLYEQHPATKDVEQIYLVEESLFFRLYEFHRQKLIYHRHTMQAWAKSQSKRSNIPVATIPTSELADIAALAKWLLKQQVHEVVAVDPSDDWLYRHLTTALQQARISIRWLTDPHWLTPRELIDARSTDESWYFTEFYIEQRKRLGILLEKNGKPVGGKWSFDAANRKKLPRGQQVPELSRVKASPERTAAIEYIAEQFPNAPGLAEEWYFQTTSQQALQHLEKFLDERLPLFGDYEDAISQRETFVYHSVLTPALNVGLITPQQIVTATLARAEQVPLNALEGFLRQLIGWREYMRAVYLRLGRQQRTSNFWGWQHAMPAAFYDGTTGIAPVDQVIQRVLRHAYCHHIERLMILGNFMLLCEIHPQHIYQWFMELFIDAYDWVMVPNVYGMSQYADGGLITTKPYISGSAYVLKMSDYPRGDWCPIWDALYWRFIDKQRDFFASNPRMSVMVAQLQKMGSKLDTHRRIAEEFLEKLHGTAKH